MNKPPFLDTLEKYCNYYHSYERDWSFKEYMNACKVMFTEDFSIWPNSKIASTRIVNWELYGDEWQDNAMCCLLDLKIMGMEYRMRSFPEYCIKYCKLCNVGDFCTTSIRKCEKCENQSLLIFSTEVRHFLVSFPQYIKENKHHLRLDRNVHFLNEK